MDNRADKPTDNCPSSLITLVKVIRKLKRAEVFNFEMDCILYKKLKLY